MADRYHEGLEGLAEFDYAWLMKAAQADRARFDEITISEGVTPEQLAPPRPST